VRQLRQSDLSEGSPLSILDYFPGRPRQWRLE